MKQLTLNVKHRAGTGRGPARRLRNEGSIPAVIYGSEGTRPVSVDSIEFRTLMRAKGSSAVLVELTDDKGVKALSLIKDFQRNALSQKIVHIDLLQVDPAADMTVSIPLHVVGEAAGVRTEGGTLDVIAHEIKVRCLPKNLPEFITVDVTELKNGESIHVADVKKLEGVSFPGDQKRTLVVCTAPEAEEAAAAPAAGAAAPAAKAAAKAPAAKAAAPAAKPAAKK
jgi:large subunit ribosomal protein L25